MLHVNMYCIFSLIETDPSLIIDKCNVTIFICFGLVIMQYSNVCAMHFFRFRLYGLELNKLLIGLMKAFQRWITFKIHFPMTFGYLFKARMTGKSYIGNELLLKRPQLSCFPCPNSSSWFQIPPVYSVKEINGSWICASVLSVLCVFECF